MRLAVLVFALLTSSAQAASFDFNRFLLDIDDQPICEAAREKDECPQGKVLTLGKAVRTALLTAYQDEANLSGEEKFKRAEIAFATKREGHDFTVDEVAIMKKLVAKFFAPVVIHPAWMLLEGKEPLKGRGEKPEKK